MTAHQLAALLVVALLPQEAPRIDDLPRRVCLDTPQAVFRVENRAAEPILANLSVERWSDEGDTPGWTVVQADITQREAQPKRVRTVKLDPRQRRDVAWELSRRVGRPSLVTGRHRLVVTYGYQAGELSGTATHEFVLVDCAD